MSQASDPTQHGVGHVGAHAAGAPPPEPRQESDEQSLGELFAEVSRDLSTLVRQEMELARAEAMVSVKRVGKGAGMVGGAGYAGSMAILFVSLAAWWGLGTVIGFGWSALVVAAVWAVVAAVLAVRGRAALKSSRGMGETVDSLKKIPNALRGHEEENR